LCIGEAGRYYHLVLFHSIGESMNRSTLDRRRRAAATLAVALAILAAAAACGHNASTDESVASVSPNAPWSYTGSRGPKHWAKLDPAYALCSDSNNQSPINIDSAKLVDAEKIEFHYQASKISIINNAHTIQVNYDSGSYITIVGVRYDLVQFHFHMPGEHKSKGKLHDGELHLVHQSADGHLAFVAVILYHKDPDNAAFATVWENMPKSPGPVRHLDAQTNANLFLPVGHAVYRYDGSLTTPPCTEGVLWNIMKDSVNMSQGQMLDFMHVIGDNYRPVQPLGGRPLLEDVTP
jgi:carbonic anhydrase